MEIIVTHREADFDALGAQIAAGKIYPGAVKVMAGGLPPSVKKFLVLHHDHFDIVPVKKVDLSAVRRMVVVDVNSRSRLRDYSPVIERLDGGDSLLHIEVFDHHPTVPDSLSGETVRIEPVGASTTLLVEEIQKAKLSLTPFEATALALGIYSDTGSLTFASTTVRDAHAAAFCVAHGASMGTLRYFLNMPLTREQLAIFSSLMTHMRSEEHNSIRFGFATVTLNKSLAGLSELVNKALNLQGYDAAFAMFVKGTTVSLIGRSRILAVDIGQIMERLGGGGHYGAGAATLKKCSPEEAEKRLMSAIEGERPVPHFVRDIMSTPVFTLSPGQILRDVHQHFSRRKFSGAPVLRDGELIGVLSKRDIIAAMESGRAHLPVSSCMSQTVRTIAPDRSLLRAMEIMSEEGIGRLPVVEEGHLIGLITRNDLLKVVYDGASRDG